MPVRLLKFPLLAVALVASMLAFGAPAMAHDDGEPDDGKAAAVILGNLGIMSPAATKPMSSVDCVNGMAGAFPCKRVDLESFLPLASLGGGTGNDIWGWTDPRTGREYALMGTSNGTSFVDVTNAEKPRVVGQMPTQSALLLPLWRDIKVYNNHAYVVSEHDNHGMQVFDLRRLRNADVADAAPRVFRPDEVYNKFSSAHNVMINRDTGFAYAVGTDTCRGGLHMVDINKPKNPSFAGCYSQDGYTHDVQCVTYHGPDDRFQGREICFASNEDTVTIVDVTNKQNPRMLSRTGYEEAAYTHQGSLTPNHRFFLFGDELDESGNTVEKTTTYIMNSGSLTDPARPIPFAHRTPSIDHNLYIDENHVYESNYTAGLRILEHDQRSLRNGQLNEVAFFDVFPASDVDEFAGTWSNYEFKSGTVVVSTLESGLFVLNPQLGGR